MAQKRALITGVAGQDGSYLAQLLLIKGYHVFGIMRSPKVVVGSALEQLAWSERAGNDRLHLSAEDVRDENWARPVLEDVKPHEIYNLAAQSSVASSFENPGHTAEVNEKAVTRILSAVRRSRQDSKFFQASSSEVFGATPPPHSELSELSPLSPYAVSKMGAHLSTADFREKHGMYAVSGISFNHESPRRPTAFVTRKISRAVASIAWGKSQKIELGNIDVIRDWGYAPEYVEGMWRSLQVDTPSDYVLATGSANSVRDFCEFACEAAGLRWQDCVEQDPRMLRPSDVTATVGNPDRAHRELGWKATVHARELAGIMVKADLERNEGSFAALDVPQLASWS
jgi:GDPmannose 4,6-dehydratase